MCLLGKISLLPFFMKFDLILVKYLEVSSKVDLEIIPEVLIRMKKTKQNKKNRKLENPVQTRRHETKRICETLLICLWSNPRRWS